MPSSKQPACGATHRQAAAASSSAAWPTLVLLLLALFGAWAPLEAEGVVVDGNKNPALSPMRPKGNQRRNETRAEELSIDSYNTKNCGLADPNFEEHEFINMAREGQFPWLVSFQIKILDDLSEKRQLELAKKRLNETTVAPAARKLQQQQQQQKGGAKFEREDLHFCSGSFISDKWILSAAHCFSDKTIENYLQNNKLIAVAGSNRVSSRSSLNRNLTIERIYIHAKFDAKLPIGHDIALVELNDGARVDFETRRKRNKFGDQDEPFFNSVCLPLHGREYEFNESARIAGWGLSEARDVHTMPSKLLTTDLLLSRPAECLKHYNRKADELTGAGQHDLLCAGYSTTRDACQSDSGGPLMQYANKKAIAIGIVSYGKGCATKGVPGLYTRTSAYTNWIREITMNERDAKVDFRLLQRPRAEAAADAAFEAANHPDDDDESPASGRPTTATPAAAPSPSIEPKPKPNAKPKVKPKTKPTPEATPTPKPVPEPEVAPAPAPEPEPTAGPDSEGATTVNCTVNVESLT